MTGADTLCRSTSKRITTTAFRLKATARSSRERTSVQKESKRMFQVERLRVVAETLHQIFEEVSDGKIEDAEGIKNLLSTISITSFDTGMKIEKQEKEADNEDS